MILSDFLRWMETASPGSKAEAIRNLCRYYLGADADDETRGTIETALTVVLDDPDPEVRFAVADILGASHKAPRHIMFALAGDRADIAVLVLARSPVFIDVELAEIATAAEMLLQVAIARRTRLSSSVAATIAEVGEKQACAALLANPTTSIARLSFRRIAERFGGDSDIREALFARSDLPPEVRQLLIRAIGNALGNLAVVRQWLPESRAHTITRDACDRATVAIAAESETHELPALVEHLRATEQLTTALLLRAVCAGNVAFFETAVAMLARLPVDRVSSLVRAGRRSALRAAYGKAGLPTMAFDAFAAALDAWQKLAAEPGPVDRYRFTIQTVNTVLARYADITDGEANELAAMLRRFAADQAREAARETARDHARALEAVAWSEAAEDEAWADEGREDEYDSETWQEEAQPVAESGPEYLADDAEWDNPAAAEIEEIVSEGAESIHAETPDDAEIIEPESDSIPDEVLAETEEQADGADAPMEMIQSSPLAADLTAEVGETTDAATDSAIEPEAVEGEVVELPLAAVREPEAPDAETSDQEVETAEAA